MAQFVGRSGFDEGQNGLAILQQGMAALGQQFDQMRAEKIKNWEDLFAARVGATKTKSTKELAKDAMFALQGGDRSGYDFFVNYLQNTKGMDPQTAEVFIKGLASTEFDAEQGKQLTQSAVLYEGMPGEEQSAAQTPAEAQPAQPAQRVSRQVVSMGQTMPDVSTETPAPRKQTISPEYAPSAPASSQPQFTERTAYKQQAVNMDKDTQRAFDVWVAAGRPEEPSGGQIAQMIQKWLSGMTQQDAANYAAAKVDPKAAANSFFTADNVRKWRTYQRGTGPDEGTVFSVENYIIREAAPATQPEGTPSPGDRLNPPAAVVESAPPQAAVPAAEPVKKEVRSGGQKSIATETTGTSAEMSRTPVEAKKAAWRAANVGQPVATATSGMSADVLVKQAVDRATVKMQKAAQTLDNRDVKGAVAANNEALQQRSQYYLSTLDPAAKREFLRYQMQTKSDLRYTTLMALSGDKDAQAVLDKQGDELTRKAQIAASEAQMKSIDAQLEKVRLDAVDAAEMRSYQNALLQYQKEKDAADRIVDDAERKYKLAELAMKNNQLEIMWAQLLNKTQYSGMTVEQKYAVDEQTKIPLAQYNDAMKSVNDYLAKNAVRGKDGKFQFTSKNKGDIEKHAAILNAYVDQINQATLSLNGAYRQVGLQELPLTDKWDASVSPAYGWFGVQVRNDYKLTQGGTPSGSTSLSGVQPGQNTAQEEAKKSGLMAPQ